MENIEKCECWIGVRYDYENTDLVALADLKEHIETMKRRPSYFHKKPYELADYCDKRKSADLTRFNYCPLCGKKIDWKAIKKEVKKMDNRERQKEMIDLLEKYRGKLMMRFIELCRGNDFNKVSLLVIGETINAIYDKLESEIFESKR